MRQHPASRVRTARLIADSLKVCGGPVASGVVADVTAAIQSAGITVGSNSHSSKHGTVGYFGSGSASLSLSLWALVGEI